MSIACILPTIRPALAQQFIKKWTPLFKKHKSEVIIVKDGENPELIHNKKTYTLKEIMGKDSDLIYNFHGGVGNLGFAYISKYLPEIEIIIFLNDDEDPLGDTIQDHIDALNKKFPISWFSTASEYMRGFPYAVRNEAECVFSHGVWKGVADWDAPTQLVKGNKEVSFYKGPIPKGIYSPISAMNIAFKRKVMPYVYMAPNSFSVGRADDIFMGINLVRACAKNNWAIASGYAVVKHERASNVFSNLKKEAPFIDLNETYWQGVEDHPYFKEYNLKRKRWEKLIK